MGVLTQYIVLTKLLLKVGGILILNFFLFLKFEEGSMVHSVSPHKTTTDSHSFTSVTESTYKDDCISRCFILEIMKVGRIKCIIVRLHQSC